MSIGVQAWTPLNPTGPPRDPGSSLWTPGTKGGSKDLGPLLDPLDPSGPLEPLVVTTCTPPEPLDPGHPWTPARKKLLLGTPWTPSSPEPLHVMP